MCFSHQGPICCILYFGSNEGITSTHHSMTSKAARAGELCILNSQSTQKSTWLLEGVKVDLDKLSWGQLKAWLRAAETPQFSDLALAFLPSPPSVSANGTGSTKLFAGAVKCQQVDPRSCRECLGNSQARAECWTDCGPWHNPFAQEMLQMGPVLKVSQGLSLQKGLWHGPPIQFVL